MSPLAKRELQSEAPEIVAIITGEVMKENKLRNSAAEAAEDNSFRLSPGSWPDCPGHPVRFAADVKFADDIERLEIDNRGVILG
jgi:hypothetical protein